MFFYIFVAKYRHIMIGRKVEQELLQEAIENDKPIISVLITTYGLERNEYSNKFQKVVTMDELFGS